MEYNNRPEKNYNEVFSKKIRAGKRTYYVDVKPTKNEDYYIVISEVIKRFDGETEKNKIFLYKEDFNKFTEGLLDAIDYVKTDLLPDYDYDKFNKPFEGEVNFEDLKD